MSWTRVKAAWGVVNMGISGNQVLSDGAGQSALARFDRDVLSVPGMRTVILFEGVNDLGISYGHFEGPMAAAFKGSFSGDQGHPRVHDRRLPVSSLRALMHAG